jgi:hypothetical protein
MTTAPVQSAHRTRARATRADLHRQGILRRDLTGLREREVLFGLGSQIYDWADPFGKLFRQTLAMVAEFEAHTFLPPASSRWLKDFHRETADVSWLSPTISGGYQLIGCFMYQVTRFLPHSSARLPVVRTHPPRRLFAAATDAHILATRGRRECAHTGACPRSLTLWN